MAFCQKCGAKLADGAKFCPECGTAAGASENETHDSSMQKFEGEIRKCPNCGAQLKSFQSICPECGHEIRSGGDVSDAIKKFFEEYKNTSKVTDRGRLVKSFPVPNTKEDFIEFFNFGLAELRYAYEGNFSIWLSNGNDWSVKLESMLSKAPLLFGSDSDLVGFFRDEYKKTYKVAKKAKFKKKLPIIVLPFIILILLMILNSLDEIWLALFTILF